MCFIRRRAANISGPSTLPNGEQNRSEGTDFHRRIFFLKNLKMHFRQKWFSALKIGAVASGSPIDDQVFQDCNFAPFLHKRTGKTPYQYFCH